MKNEKGCPGTEQISAYFDKECKNPEMIEQHLKECPECQAFFDALSKIDYSLKHGVRNQTGSDEEISAQILKRVHETVGEFKKPGKRFFLSPVQWRAASLLLIAGALGYFIWDDYQARHGMPELPMRVESSAKVPAALASFSGGTPLQMKELKPVYFAAAGTIADGSADSAVISPEIRHVWQGPHLSRESLQKLLSKLNLHPIRLELTGSQWNIAFKCTKLQAVHFVRELANVGYQLLSPDQPQPESSKFRGSAEDSVFYTAIISERQ